MKEPHPADALTEALLACAKAKNMGQDYVAGYLNHVLRRVVDRLPGYHRNIALADLKMSLRLTEDALKEIQK
jgi:hypothetical protein